MENDELREAIKARLIELDIQTIPCRDCGQDIWFIKNRVGKFMPMEPDLELHNCPKKERSFRPRNNFTPKPDYNRNNRRDKYSDSNDNW